MDGQVIAERLGYGGAADDHSWLLRKLQDEFIEDTLLWTKGDGQESFRSGVTEDQRRAASLALPVDEGLLL